MPAPAPRPPPSRGLVEALRLLAAPPAFEAAPPAEEGVAYREARRPGVPPLADVWRPAEPGGGASVVIVHGGGFVIGSRRMKPVRFLATRLAAAGLACAAVDYRLIGRGGRLDEAVEDVRDALAWWRAAAPSRGLDPDRVSVAGFSAGAALAWLAVAGGAPPPERVVSFYGVYDFAWLGGAGAGALRRLLLRTADPEAWRAASPVARCHTPAPALLLHGTADRLVPLDHAERLLASREARGLPTRLVTYDGEPHGFLNDAARPASERAVAEVLAFLGAPVRSG